MTPAGSAKKRMGILGGLSPESTVATYQHITRRYTERFGDYAYPEIIIHSVSFQPYVDWPKSDRWDLVAQGLCAAARNLEKAGADFIIVPTNTMHVVIDQVQAAVRIPVLSLLDAVGDAVVRQGIPTVGLLGTKFTMEKPFYRDALAQKGITTLVPGAEGREYVHRAIYEELTAGRFLDRTREGLVSIIKELAGRGCEGVILGCTEIPLLVRQTDVDLPLFDTTAIHAEAALDYALA